MHFLHVRFCSVSVRETEFSSTCSVRFGQNGKTLLRSVTSWKVRGWSLGLKSPGLRCPLTLWWVISESCLNNYFGLFATYSFTLLLGKDSCMILWKQYYSNLFWQWKGESKWKNGSKIKTQYPYQMKKKFLNQALVLSITFIYRWAKENLDPNWTDVGHVGCGPAGGCWYSPLGFWPFVPSILMSVRLWNFKDGGSYHASFLPKKTVVFWEYGEHQFVKNWAWF